MEISKECFNLFIICFISCLASNECDVEFDDCKENTSQVHIYTKAANNNTWYEYLEKINLALTEFKPCSTEKCSCHYPLITKDLKPFQNGIYKEDIEESNSRGTLYQIINHQLFRDADCMFPSRCSGIEYFILKIIKNLPDTEFILNTRDWPQAQKHYGIKRPIFSFSKTKDYLDIIYPAWTFWEGGPAISIYPTGLGQWEKHRQSLMKEADSHPWTKKIPKAFFRGSRTSSERDPLIYLSRKKPELVDAQYTKNQAWKSDADTLYAKPASEVTLESHCHYKYLFNYRGVAASFRFKHLFLCKSLVYHVGQDWIEFFYPQLKPWVHYIPVSSGATESELEKLIMFAKENDEAAQQISERGFNFIKDHLRIKDVLCYWKKLIISYSKLITYKPTKRKNLIEIKKKN